MDVLEAIRTRRSVKKLTEPAPTETHLNQMLEAAVLAPDHKERAPWRFIVIEGEGRDELGRVLAQALRARDPEATPGSLEKEAGKPLRAPMIVGVAAAREESKLPFSELVSATDAAIQNLLLAAHGLGYGAIWKTGAGARDPYVKRALGLNEEDELLAFIHLGTPVEQPEPRRAQLEGKVRRWPSQAGPLD